VETHGLQLRPYVPSGKDFDAALAFYTALGFVKNWHHKGLAEMQAGEAVFILQNFENIEMQTNYMLYLTVEDVDDWYERVQASEIFEAYEEARIRPPTDYPWGAREVHFIDPAGVCWHVATKGKEAGSPK